MTDQHRSSGIREYGRERHAGVGYDGLRDERTWQPAGHRGKGPKGYQRSDDRIREDVCERLSDDDELDASDISVTVGDGDVTLAGTVTDRHAKQRAEDLAASIGGVRDVDNQLRRRSLPLRS